MSIDKIKKELTKLGSPKKKKVLQSFFKTGKGQYGQGDIFLGVSMPEQRIIAKKYLELPHSDVIKLLRSNVHEHRMTALLIWTYQYEKADESSDEKTKERIYKDYLKNTKWINNWDLVDVTTPKIVGMYLLNKGKKEREILYKLSKSKDLWEKRISILATFAFINKGNESKDTLKIAEILLKDKHDLIHKAVGWMLREVGKRVSQLEEEKFLKKYYKIMPRTMLRYAIERFDKKKKNFI